ncbi:MAG: SIMPL domain-containing protein, partial [Alistipes sp.]
MKELKYIVIGLALIVCALLLSRAYTYKYRAQDTIVVTGLGETVFTSDLIVWNATLTAEAQTVAAGYAQIEANKLKVQKYLTDKGLPADALVFEFVNVTKQFDPIYNASGNWAGQRFTGYELRQGLTVESADVEKVETISREISSLIAQGVAIEANAPDYYYTKLDDVKLGLIEKASADARVRAEKIAENAGTKIGKVASARMGVFQITGANSNEEFAAGGSFNTSSRSKKARITMRLEYR